MLYGQNNLTETIENTDVLEHPEPTSYQIAEHQDYGVHMEFLGDLHPLCRVRGHFTVKLWLW